MAKQPGLTQEEKAAVDKAGRAAGIKAEEAGGDARQRAVARVEAKKRAIAAVVKARGGSDTRKRRGRGG